MQSNVFDYFLSLEYFNKIKNTIESEYFPWYYEKNITYESESNSLYSYGFYYPLIGNYIACDCNIYKLLIPFYNQLLFLTKCTKISKSRIDMVTYSPDKYQHDIHVDEFFPHTSTVFYITNSDAETVIYDKQCFGEDQIFDSNTLKIKKRIKPKENRLLFFDGTYLHTGCSPSQYKRRIIINTDLVK